MNAAPLIEVDDLDVFFGNTSVLKSLHLTVPTNGALGILGASGSGKTTLLNAICGFIPLRSGSVRVNLPTTTDRLQKAMVFQDHGLFEHLTVFENIAFGLVALKKTKSESRDRVMYLSQLFELEPMLGKKASNLSGGQKQRVGLARALAPYPQILFLDEPFSQLDRPLRETIRHRVRHITREEKITVLMVSHDYADIFTLTDHVAVLDRGSIIQEGLPSAVYADPRSIIAARLSGRLVAVRARLDGSRYNLGAGQLQQSISVQSVVKTARSLPINAHIAYRPENGIVRADLKAQDSLTFRGRFVGSTQVVDHHEWIVDIGTPSEFLIGRAERHQPMPTVDSEIHIAIEHHDLLLFSSDTGERIR